MSPCSSFKPRNSSVELVKNSSSYLTSHRTREAKVQDDEGIFALFIILITNPKKQVMANRSNVRQTLHVHQKKKKKHPFFGDLELNNLEFWQLIPIRVFVLLTSLLATRASWNYTEKKTASEFNVHARQDRIHLLLTSKTVRFIFNFKTSPTLSPTFEDEY